MFPSFPLMVEEEGVSNVVRLPKPSWMTLKLGDGEEEIDELSSAAIEQTGEWRATEDLVTDSAASSFVICFNQDIIYTYKPFLL